MWRVSNSISRFLVVRYVVLSVVVACLANTARVEAGGVRGYVFGLNAEGVFERPIKGATVEFLSPDGGVVAKATTNAAGYYQVRLAPGVYRYRVSAPGYKTDDAGRQISVQFPDRYVLRNFSLKRGEDKRPEQQPPTGEKPGVLTGHVFEDRAGRRIGVPGARIVLKGPTGTYEVFSAEMSPKSSGEYRITLPPGTYSAAVLAVGFAPATAQGIELRAGQTTEHDFVLHRLPGKAGAIKVTPRIEPRPARPVPGKVELWVRSLDARNRILGPIEGSLGASTAVKVPPGRYLVLGYAGGGRYHGQAGPVTVGAGETTSLELVLSGSKGEDQSAASLVIQVVDGAGRPIAGVRVLVRRPDQPLRAANSGVTDSQGQAAFHGLEPGAYQVLAQKEGFRPEGRSVDLTGGKTAAVRLVLQQGSGAPGRQLARVTGYVVYPSKRSETGYFGVGGARIEWTPLGDSGRAVTVATDRTGRYELSLPAGKYMARVLPPGDRFGIVQEMVEVPPGALRKFFVLRSREVVSGDTVPVRGVVGVRTAGALGRLQPVAGARVSFREATQRLGDAASAVSDRRGTFRVQLPPGEYVVSVLPPPGYSSRQLRVRVSPGMGPLVIELTTAGESGPGGGPQPAVIQVVQAVGPLLPALRPVPGAIVRIYSQGRLVAGGRTDASGTYQAVLPDGVYRVVAEAGGLTGTASLVVRNGGRAQVVLRRRAVQEPQAGVPGEPDGSRTAVTIEVVAVRLADEIRESAPFPVRGATVLFRTGGEVVHRGVTGRGGRYVTKLRPGRYLVVVRHPRLGRATVNIVVGTRPLTKRVLLPGRPVGVPRASVPQ